MTRSFPVSSLLLITFAAVLSCRGPRQWAETDAAQATDTRSVMLPMGSDGGSSMGHDTGGPVTGDGPAVDVPAPTPTNPQLRRLLVTVTGPGELTADGQPVACPGSCAIDRPPGAPVTLAATPATVSDRPISLFRGWSGACTGRAGCVVTLDDNKTLMANFHRFVAWEEEIVVAAGERPRLRLSPVGRDFYISGEFSNTVSVGRHSFASAGYTDGIVMRYSEDGQAMWSKTIAGSGAEGVGLVVPGLAAAELRVAGHIGATGGVFGMQALPRGPLQLFLSRDGELLRFVPVQFESESAPFYGPLEPSPYQNRFAHIDFNGADGTTRLQLIDENGRALWSKPDVTRGQWFDARVCDSAGSVVALHPLTDQVTIAGATFEPSSGDTLLVKVSLQGEYVWATPFTVDWPVTALEPTVFCDQAGDVYVAASFKDEFKVGGRSVRAQDAFTDVAVFKVRGVTPQLQWLSTFGSRYEDAAGPWAVEAGGKLLIAPTFIGDVTIAGETFPEGQVFVRIDSANGTAVTAFRSGRTITAMATHPTAGAYFVGSDRLGQVIPPP